MSGLLRSVAFVAGGLVGCLSAPAVADSSPACPEPIAEITQKEGTVRHLAPGSPFAEPVAELPLALCPGDQVHTLSSSRARLVHEHSEVVLEQKSSLTLRDESEAIMVTEGVVLFDVTRADHQRLETETPLAVIGVKGTRFLLSAGDERHDVALLDGRLEVARRDGEDMAYHRAQEARDRDFSEYRARQSEAFSNYRSALSQSFSDYKEQQNAAFEAFVASTDLEPGRQLTLSTGSGKEAIDAPLAESLSDLGQDLSDWSRP